MYVDVQELRDFYARPLGQTVRRMLCNRIRARWRNVAGMSVFGLGYAVPYLGMFRGEATRLGALMPAGQGVLTWPEQGPYQTALVDEFHLPLPDASVDRLIAVHNLEMCEAAHNALREMWRVLTPEGRLMLIVPNRRGVWARFDHTPFGHGRPYSRRQMSQLLSDSLFETVESWRGLYFPPFDKRLMLRYAASFERIGLTMWPRFSGVLIVEATKTVYAQTGKKAFAKSSLRLRPVSATPFKTQNSKHPK